MPNRALVIGINDYANPEWTLDGAVDDAVSFARWALEQGNVAEGDLTLLLAGDTDTDLPAGVAKSRDIRKAILDIHDSAATGDRLFFYYAGHGCSAPGVLGQGASPEPTLIPSDVERLPLDSNLCIAFSEVMPVLDEASYAEQFFFIDACRDFPFEGYRTPLGMTPGIWIQPPGKKTFKDQYVLYATAPGERAQEDKALRQGVFGATLLAGLRGAPRATRWNGDSSYEVTWSRLTEFVKAQTQKQIRDAIPVDWARYMQEPQSRGAGDPCIRSIPLKKMKRLPVTLQVSPKTARQTCELRLLHRLPGVAATAEGGTVEPPLDAEAKVNVYPATYTLEAQATNYRTASEPLEVWSEVVKPVDLEPCEAPQQPVAARATGKGGLSVTCADASVAIYVFDAGRKRVGSGIGTVFAGGLEAGLYTVRQVTAEGSVSEQHVEVAPGEPQRVQLEAAGSRIGTEQLDMLRKAGIEQDDHGFLHPVTGAPLADARLGTVLAYAAFASQGPTGGADLGPLHELGIDRIALGHGGSAILAIVAASGASPATDVSRDEFVHGGELLVRNLEGETIGHERVVTLSGMETAAQAAIRLEPGSVTAELRVPGAAPTRYALTALPDRVTALIAVAGDSGGMEVQQYLIGRDARSRVSARQIRRLDLAQRHYARGALPAGIEQLEDLLYGKWVDPLLGALAGYALVRAGKPEHYVGDAGPHDRYPQPSALRNMLHYFGRLPDSHVLAGLVEPERRDEHFTRAIELGMPVFADGFRALHAWTGTFAGIRRRGVWVEPSALLPGSSWTAWVAERPVIRVADDGAIGAAPPGWAVLEGHRNVIDAVIPSVGSIRTAGKDTAPSGGVFAVGPGLVMTMGFVPTDEPLVVDFGTKPGTTGPAFAVHERVGTVELPEPASLLLLRTEDGPRFPPPLRLARELPEPSEGRRVYLVGFPIAGLDVPDDVLERTFGGVYGVKRVQPGLLLTADDHTLVHDCLTLAGNAGSPVFDLDSGLVLAVHHSGMWAQYKRGEAVPLWPLAHRKLLERLDVWG